MNIKRKYKVLNERNWHTHLKTAKWIKITSLQDREKTQTTKLPVLSAVTHCLRWGSNICPCWHLFISIVLFLSQTIYHAVQSLWGCTWRPSGIPKQLGSLSGQGIQLGELILHRFWLYWPVKKIKGLHDIDVANIIR